MAHQKNYGSNLRDLPPGRGRYHLSSRGETTKAGRRAQGARPPPLYLEIYKGRLFLVMALVMFPILFCSCLESSTFNDPPPAVVGADGSTDTAPAPGTLAQNLPWVDARLGVRQLRIMVARTEAEKRTGLMFRTELGENEGMLFVYPAPQMMTFWMKNTILPLDLLFFSNDLELTESIPGMKPGIGIPETELPRYSSAKAAQYALELASGTVKKWGIVPGNRLEVPLPFLDSN